MNPIAVRKKHVYTVNYKGTGLKIKMGGLHMAESTLTKIKRIQVLLFILVFVMLFFAGCGEPEAGSVKVEDMRVPMSGGVDVNAIGTGEWTGAQNSNEAGSPGEQSDPAGVQGAGGAADTLKPAMEINSNKTSVIYQGTPFMSSCRAIGGDSIYTTGFLGEFNGEPPAEGTYFAGRIGIEENAMQQFTWDIPEDMFAYRACIDTQGKCHLLLSQKTDDSVADRRTEIWVIGRDGELEQSIDITESVKDGFSIPYWMTVDSHGNYYFASGEKITVIDLGKQSVGTFHFGGEIIGMGMGRSGALYGVFIVDGDCILGTVTIENGSIEKCAVFPENSKRPTFSVIQEGVDTELLLANKGEGVWSYDGTDLKQVLSMEGINANGQDILAMGFLWDGRVCVMSYEEGNYVFRYVPVEV